jgi:DNA-nicking Smr family endonuclease
MAKKEEPFHAPFRKLKGVKVTAGKKSAPEEPAKPKQPPAEPDDREIFSSAMRGVTPLGNDCIVVPEPTDPRDIVNSIKENVRKQDREVIDALHALVKGTAHFDITCTGEYLEGHTIPLDPKTMSKLKAGELTVQGHLDLHGYTKQAAEQAITSFLLSSHALGHRVVLVIHGRGLKSSQGPVLKEHLIRWLTTGNLSHLVLAFSSARPCDGGTGALYILLKKRPKKSKWNRPV